MRIVKLDNTSITHTLDFKHSRNSLNELESELLKGVYIGDYIGEYYRGY